MSTLRVKQSKIRSRQPISRFNWTEPLLATVRLECLQESELIRRTKAVISRFETQIEEWLGGKNRNQRIQCRKGCGFCCNVLNWISLAEAATIYPLITRHERHHFSRLDTALLSLARRTTEEDLFEAYRTEVGFCPLFDSNRSCRVHPQRPLSCRSVFSFFPPVLCRADLPRRYGLDQLNAIITRHPSDEYFETPFALTPILWKEKASYQLEKIMISRFDFTLEGAFPAMIQLVDMIARPTRNQTRSTGMYLSTWLTDRIQTGLVSILSD